MFDREPDLGGLRHTVNRLRSGAALEDVVRTFIVSPEFRQRMLKAAVPDIDLPDLTQAMPEMYRRQTVGDVTATVYTARADADIARMTALIEDERCEQSSSLKPHAATRGPPPSGHAVAADG